MNQGFRIGRVLATVRTLDLKPQSIGDTWKIAPGPDWIVTTESGRVVGAGDIFTAADGPLVAMSGGLVDVFLPAGSTGLRPVAFPVLRALASALFGWLP
jgi:hypothetical protein